jgi:nicotinamide-nucleotide amidase
MNTPKQIVGYLKSRGLVLATVETCTAGHLAAMLADVPGAAGCLDIGLVVHAGVEAAAMPGVRAETVARFGPISEPVARELAEGVLAQRAGHADVVVVSLGALPALQEPHLATAPVAQYLAWARVRSGQVFSEGETVLLSGNRNEIRRSIVQRALPGVPRFVDAVIRRLSVVDRER